MIEQLSTLFTDFDEYKFSPVTVRCRVAGEAQLGTEGGRKTLYRVGDPVGDVPAETFLSFWHTTPFDGSLFEQTDREVLSLIMPQRDGIPLEPGEDVLVRGVPNYSDAQDRYYINVTSILVRQPDLQIGKSQLRVPNECERLIHLLYEKNVYRPRDSFGGNAKSSGALRGRIAHKAFEYALTRQPYIDYFDQGLWDRDAVESLIEEVLNNEFLVEQALHSLRGTGKNEAVDTATAAVEELVSSEQLTEIVASASTIQSEAGLAQAYGFNGQVDLIADGIPYDLKTGNRKQADTFQMKLYLFALLLERLDIGDSVRNELESGIGGFLIYADGSGDSATFQRVELSDADVTNLMELRTTVVTARSQFGVPSPYGEDCEECILRSGDDHAGLDEEHDPMPSACKFHCQSERRWPCYDVNSEYGFETRCPLFDECDQRFEFRNPDITDHYNELRSALHSERRVRNDISDFLARLSDETLVQAGLLLPELAIKEFVSDRRIAYSSPTAVSGLEVGDTVEITQSSHQDGWTATYLGQRENHFVFEFESRPGHRATHPEATYEARRTPRAASLPEKYLRYLDFAQRTGVDPRLRTPDDDLDHGGESSQVASVDQIDFEATLSVPEVFVDVPVRPDRDAVLEQLVENVSSSVLPVLDTEGTGPSEETVPYGEKRTLVLCSRPLTVDHLHQTLKNTSGYVRFDGSDDGDRSLPGDRNQHEIKEELKSSRLVLSATQFAITEEVFHYMASGDPDHRTHSSKFFDTVLLLGADRISEPAFHFLSKLADRTVSVADLRRRDIDLLSEDAVKADLTQPYFRRAFERYDSVETPNVNTRRLSGMASETAVQVLNDSRLKSLDHGEIDVIDCSGTEELETETMTVETSVECAGDEPRRLGFEVVNPSSTAADIGPIFAEKERLDATAFEPGEQYILSETTLKCVTNDPIDNENAMLHRISIHIAVSSAPFLSSRLLSNQSEAHDAVSVAIDRDADVLLTPFTAQASFLREQVAEQDGNIPVRTTAEWTGNTTDSAVISTAVANEEKIVRSPVNQFETLYSILTAGTTVTIVGNQETLRSNDVLRTILTSPTVD